ncbi:hypothetical protein [Pseudidiomarina indica]|nr:hypothetical protein [Pseudidiomarina indica]
MLQKRIDKIAKGETLGKIAKEVIEALQVVFMSTVIVVSSS